MTTNPTTMAKTVAVQFTPAGAIRRQEAPDPGNCPFRFSTGHASGPAPTARVELTVLPLQTADSGGHVTL